MVRIFTIVQRGFAARASVSSVVPVVYQEWKTKAEPLTRTAQNEATNQLFPACIDVNQRFDFEFASVAQDPDWAGVVAHLANVTSLLAWKVHFVL